MREQLSELMKRVSAETDARFQPVVRLKEKVIKNALASCDGMCSREDIVGIWDVTLMGSGKEGYILAVDGLYSERFGKLSSSKEKKIPFQGLCAICQSGVKSAFITASYQDGKELVAYVGRVHMPAIMGILNGVIAMNHSTGGQAEAKPAAPPNRKPNEKQQPEGQQEPIPEKKAEGKQESKPALKLSMEECYVQGMDQYLLLEYDLAFPLLKKVCDKVSPNEKKYADAQVALGWMYENGKGTGNDMKMAAHYYSLAAENGNRDGEHGYVRAVHMRMDVTEEETKKALGYIEGFKIRKLYAEDSYDEGLKLYQKRKFEKAFEYLLTAAKCDNIQAQYGIASMYQEGQGTDVNEEEALKWYRKAGLRGHMRAQFECGLIYELGKGTERDEQEALRWFLRAAKRGHVDSQYLCGLLYMDEEFPESDPEKGRYWLELAAEQGSENAKRMLGNL